MKNIDAEILLFAIITLINVVLSTAKSILTIKASRKVAALINAVSYGFYAMVVKQMASVSLEAVVIITVLANLIGVYFSMWLLDKFKKDVFWKVTIIPKNENFADIRKELVENELGFNEYEVNTRDGNQKALDVFSENTAASKKLKEILNKYGNVKYHISEIGNQL